VLPTPARPSTGRLRQAYPARITSIVFHNSTLVAPPLTATM